MLLTPGFQAANPPCVPHFLRLQIPLLIHPGNTCGYILICYVVSLLTRVLQKAYTVHLHISKRSKPLSVLYDKIKKLLTTVVKNYNCGLPFTLLRFHSILGSN